MVRPSKGQTEMFPTKGRYNNDSDTKNVSNTENVSHTENVSDGDNVSLSVTIQH